MTYTLVSALAYAVSAVLAGDIIFQAVRQWL